jgi:indole-3-glycerol phosphate synthase
LRAVRAAVELPVLRKDFLFDPYHVYQARAAGADALLLIVAVLEQAALVDLIALTHELGMDALVEAHDDAELDRGIAAGARVLGINNRDLHSFDVDLAVTERLAPRVPADRTIVGESGVFTRPDAERLQAAGVHAILVGEALMRRGLAGVGEKIAELRGGLTA